MSVDLLHPATERELRTRTANKCLPAMTKCCRHPDTSVNPTETPLPSSYFYSSEGRQESKKKNGHNQEVHAEGRMGDECSVRKAYCRELGWSMLGEGREVCGYYFK